MKPRTILTKDDVISFMMDVILSGTSIYFMNEGRKGTKIDSMLYCYYKGDHIIFMAWKKNPNSNEYNNKIKEVDLKQAIKLINKYWDKRDEVRSETQALIDVIHGRGWLWSTIQDVTNW